MAQVIWKYQFSDLVFSSRKTFYMPVGSRIVYTDMQNDRPTMWAIGDPNVEGEDRNFVIVATGEQFPNYPNKHLEYIGTTPSTNHTYIWHILEIIDERTPL